MSTDVKAVFKTVNDSKSAGEPLSQIIFPTSGNVLRASRLQGICFRCVYLKQPMELDRFLQPTWHRVGVWCETILRLFFLAEPLKELPIRCAVEAHVATPQVA